MDIKFLLSILNSPWFIEPNRANYWAGIANQFLTSGMMPQIDKRGLYTDDLGMDLGPVFRVNADTSVNPNGPVQVFRMDAPVAKYDYCGSPGSQTWSQLFQAAYKDPTVAAIVMVTDSPGGQVAGTEDLANTVKAKNKPVLTFVDETLCSAIYWIASPSDEIIVTGANNGWLATVGSIGTMSSWLDDSAKMKKEGVVLRTVFADDSSEKWGDYFKIQKGDYSELKKQLNALNDTFLNAVKTNRGAKLKEETLHGSTYNANDAVRLGLADSIGDFATTVTRALTLAEKSSTKTQNKMSKPNHSFQQVLAAAKATEFAVVDGGFMLSEEQLNNVNAVLDNHETILTATASQLKQLQTQSAEASEAATQLTQATAELSTTKEELAKAQTELTEANKKNEALEKQAGGFFVRVKSDGDPAASPESEEDYQSIIDNLPHNKNADQMGFTKSK